MDLWYRFHHYINKYEDSLTGKWFLMTSPFPVLITLCVYLYVVKVVLPAHMENRKPFECRRILTLYDFLQVSLNVWLFHGLLPGGMDALECYPDGSELSNHGPPEYTKNFTYYFHLSKYSDLLDTILFLLRKKNSQVTLLHVYHHCTMPFWTWMSVKYGPDGRLTFHALLNSFVHIVMYTYYLLSGMGPRMKKYLWWKKYVTLSQMVQFVLISLHAAQSAIYGCNVYKTISILNGLQSAIYFILFCDFYKKAYRKMEKIKKEIIGDCLEVTNKKDE